MDVLLVFRLCLFFKVLKRASPYSPKRKMNQKEKSQPGSVAIKVSWLGEGSDCRHITNAALVPIAIGRLFRCSASVG
jgi:hypothetical protein